MTPRAAVSRRRAFIRSLEAFMPSGKTIAWTVAIAIAVNLGLEHYRTVKG